MKDKIDLIDFDFDLKEAQTPKEESEKVEEKQDTIEELEDETKEEIKERKLKKEAKKEKKAKVSDGENSKPSIFSGLHTTIYFIVLFLYLEFIFHVFEFKLADFNFVYITLFAAAGGALFSLFANFLPKVGNRIVTVLLTFAACIFYYTQFLYGETMHNFLSFVGTIQYTNQVMDCFSVVIINMKENWFFAILVLLPMVVVAALLFGLNFERRPLPCYGIIVALIIVLYGGGIVALKCTDNSADSAYHTYKSYESVDQAVERLGVWEAFLVDVRFGIWGNGGHVQFASTEDVFAELESTDTTEVTTEEMTEATTEAIDTSPNVLDIDFDEVNETANSNGVTELSNYFQTVTPTNKNEYTGRYEGYNVIWVTAEGFSGYLLEEKSMFPTLNMMAKNGFVFENFYTPLNYGSTLGGEYATQTGNMPKNGGYLSMRKAASRGNSFAFTLGNQLKRKNYNVYGFHDNSASYYDRDISHPMLGFEWIANGTGLDAQKTESGNTPWPQSDYIMIQDTFDRYADQEPFHVYYLTVSGHMEYNFGGNAMAIKNKDKVEGKHYSETTLAYLACQYELEAAMTELIADLKERGLYENTVIILSGDHVPYDAMEVLDELAGHELEDTFEAYKSTLIIFSGDMEQPVYVDKVCGAIDILPTVSNLMGVPYDSRLLAGQDILSDSEGLVIFPDRSFITDAYSYKASNGSVEPSFGFGEPSEAEIENMKSVVANKYTASDNVTEYDYYKYIEKYIK